MYLTRFTARKNAKNIFNVEFIPDAFHYGFL